MTKPVNDKIRKALDKEADEGRQASYELENAGRESDTKKAADRLKEARKTFKKTIDTIDDIVKVLDED